MLAVLASCRQAGRRHCCVNTLAIDMFENFPNMSFSGTSNRSCKVILQGYVTARNFQGRKKCKSMWNIQRIENRCKLAPAVSFINFFFIMC